MRSSNGASITHFPVLMSTEAKVDPQRWLQRHGDMLFRFALARVSDPLLAEDLVQETLLAALNAAPRFEGKSAEQTWLVGILRHKILDHYRRNGREQRIFDRDTAPEVFDALPAHPSRRRGGLHEPARGLDHEDFWRLLDEGLGGLPPRTAEAFRLSEIDQEDSGAICARLGISKANLWVMLHRARKHLRTHFQSHWLAPDPAPLAAA